MPNVEHIRMTSADVWEMNNSEEVIGLINTCTRAIPELQHIGASPITKTEYKTLILKELPTVGFRESNVGRKQQKATLDTSAVVCPIPQQQETASLDAVVRVRTIVSERSSSLGSGAIVQWGGATVILTAEHVIRGARDARAVSVRIDGEYRRVPVYYIDNVCDFAILGLPEKCRIPGSEKAPSGR